MQEYFQAASNTQIAGRAIGYLFNQLKKKGLNVQFHCVGHSLGSHVCANAGFYTQSEFGWKIDRITGLDPAGLNFEHSDVAVRIDKSDAEFVDIIHTNTGPTGAGITAPLGHADFYPNGGHKVFGILYFVSAEIEKKTKLTCPLNGYFHLIDLIHFSNRAVEILVIEIALTMLLRTFGSIQF